MEQLYFWQVSLLSANLSVQLTSGISLKWPVPIKQIRCIELVAWSGNRLFYCPVYWLSWGVDRLVYFLHGVEIDCCNSMLTYFHGVEVHSCTSLCTDYHGVEIDCCTFLCTDFHGVELDCCVLTVMEWRQMVVLPCVLTVLCVLIVMEWKYTVVHPRVLHVRGTSCRTIMQSLQGTVFT